MATTLSSKQFFERQATDSLRADQPMDAGYVWTLVDNIAHMVDECGKYRINWMSWNDSDLESTTNGFYHYGTPAADGSWWIIFPTTIVIDSQYPRYDVRVATFRAAEDAVIRISLTTTGVNAPVLGDTQSGVIGSSLHTLDASAFPAATSDVLFPSKSANTAPIYTTQAPYYAGAEAHVGSICLVKLIVETIEPEPPSEGVPIIIGVQVREYLR